MIGPAFRPPAFPPGYPWGLILLFWGLGICLVAFIVLPLLALGGTPSSANLLQELRSVGMQRALALSLAGAFIAASVAALVGVPLAYVLARTSFPGKGVVAALIDLPLAVPHTVAGIALLMVFGRQGILGAPLAAAGIRFWGSIAGVVAAMLFVSAPYAVNAARLGFEAVDPRLEKVARSLGMGPWRTLLHVTLPLSWRGIMTGLTLTYARAISEFGAVIVLVYYPMTAPVRIYELFLRFGLDEAAAGAVLLLAVALGLFILLRQVAYGSGAHGGGR